MSGFRKFMKEWGFFILFMATFPLVSIFGKWPLNGPDPC